MISVQEFAKQSLGIELTSAQIRYIRAWASNGRLIIVSQRHTGVTLANKVCREYIKAHLS